MSKQLAKNNMNMWLTTINCVRKLKFTGKYFVVLWT